MLKKRKTAGEISKQIDNDTTKYNALEVGHAMAEDIEKHLYESISLYKDRIEQDEFCVVMLIGEDPLFKWVKRRKFYCWPYLPKPRPNQAVFLYNKRADRIIKRLWALPSAMVMAELVTLACVDKTYQTMQAWSMAFFKGTFWEYIRHEHKIDMLSETEFLELNREKILKSQGDFPDSDISETFDFSKFHIKNVIDTQTAI